MTIRSMKLATGASLLAAVLTVVGTSMPERQASAQVQAVPRAGMAFNDTVTQRVTIEAVDPDDRTVAFTKPDGQLVVVAVANGVDNLAALRDGSVADVTYTQVVTILNLRQKGPGSQEARRDQMSPTPDKTDIEAGRFTVTVVGVDLAKNTVSIIEGRGGPVRTFEANTPAKQDMLKKMKVGDVVIGITTPLTVTAISPAS
jgi:ABC-type Fe3+-hydroxamate transport system substrate-binding protein